MWYIKRNNQLASVNDCLIQGINGHRHLTRLYFMHNGQQVGLELPSSLIAEGKIINGGIGVLNGSGILFNQPGNYSFEVPPYISKVNIVAIGAGGSGGRKDLAASGGGGGGLAAISEYIVTDNRLLSITVGQGGVVDVKKQINGNPGGDSMVQTILLATGGQGGAIGERSDILLGGLGGNGMILAHSGYTASAIGTGGLGGIGKHELADAAGGGGAAGYNGNGGNGGGGASVDTLQAGLEGSHGGGGGGGSSDHKSSRGGMGGGVGPFGLGNNGSGSPNTSNSLAENGQHGSVHTNYPDYVFGAGSGGQDVGGSQHVQPGQNGAVLISWGEELILN